MERSLRKPMALMFAFWLLVTSDATGFAGERVDFAPLINKAQLLLKQESYPAAIAVLENVLERDPENAEAATTLLDAYDAYSQKLVKQGQFELAQKYLERSQMLLSGVTSYFELPPASTKAESRLRREKVAAQKLLSDPQSQDADLFISLNSGRELYNEAVKHFEAHEYDLAQKLLKDSTELDPTNPFAFELLGDIANLKQDLQSAKQYYQKAFLLNPDARLRTKFEKLSVERNVDSDKQHYLDQNFIIRYRRGQEYEGSEIRSVLREAYKSISKDFGYYPQYKIPVILYDRDEYNAIAEGSPHWSGAMYDGKIRLPAYTDSMTKTNFKKFVFHELTHAFVLDLSKSRSPVWLQEGLAQYEENKIVPINKTVLSAAAQSGRLLPIERILYEDVGKITNQGDAILYYLQSFSLASAIIEKYRFYRVKQILNLLGEGKLFEEAFESICGSSFQDFTRQWLKNLQS